MELEVAPVVSHPIDGGGGQAVSWSTRPQVVTIIERWFRPVQCYRRRSLEDVEQQVAPQVR
jgi:hypothetical protein